MGIVSNVPFKGKEDMYSKCRFTEAESAAVKKYDAKFIFLEPRPEYVIDNINNGLYRQARRTCSGASNRSRGIVDAARGLLGGVWWRVRCGSHKIMRHSASTEK